MQQRPYPDNEQHWDHDLKQNAAKHSQRSSHAFSCVFVSSYLLINPFRTAHRSIGNVGAHLADGNKILQIAADRRSADADMPSDFFGCQAVSALFCNHEHPVQGLRLNAFRKRRLVNYISSLTITFFPLRFKTNGTTIHKTAMIDKMSEIGF